ncbi:hypothetical protein [Spirosoma foliorum]|uniref:Uncharacterized protein n=1 Tax=Spirosoma foliorum TaxID=2710596 RepID=A0A7G5H184_9BACT|nr:hypothetical protein [Spirosoma foliorum]QMW04876.1 hypothetical protein H3H32_08190 [Spirosoma foliorum]
MIAYEGTYKYGAFSPKAPFKHFSPGMENGLPERVVLSTKLNPCLRMKPLFTPICLLLLQTGFITQAQTADVSISVQRFSRLI